MSDYFVRRMDYS